MSKVDETDKPPFRHPRPSRAGARHDARALRVMAGSASAGVNRALRADLERSFLDRFRQRSDDLDRLERLICLVDRVLRITQPPKSGKIGIRWWIRSGPAQTRLNEGHDVPVALDLSRMRHPVLVRWLRSDRIQGRWRAVPLKQVRATLINREGTSAINHAVTVDLARLGSDLIKVYESRWLKMVAWHGQPVDVAGWALKLDGVLAKIEGLHARAVINLLNEGYDVDERSRQIVSLWEAGEDVLPDVAVDAAEPDTAAGPRGGPHGDVSGLARDHGGDDIPLD